MSLGFGGWSCNSFLGGFVRKMDFCVVGLGQGAAPGQRDRRLVKGTKFQGPTSLQGRLCQGQRCRLKTHLAWLLFYVNLKSHAIFENC